MRPYGWAADGSTDPDEVAVLRSAVDDVIAGRPVNQIVRDLNDQGISTSGGSRWTIASLTRTLRNPRLTGRRRDRNGNLTDLPDVEPIIDVEQHDRLLAVLDDPQRKRSAPKSKASLLTGLVWCRRCDARMARRGPAFRCTVCDSAIAATPLEAEVSARVLSRILTPVWQAALAGALSEETYRAELSEIDGRMVTLAVEFGDSGDRAALEAGLAAARRRRAQAEEGLALAGAAAVLDGLSDEELVRWWAGAAPSVQRDVIDVVLERVEVLPTDTATGDDRVAYQWR